MVYVIMNDDVHRHQSGRSWQSKAILFLIGATLAGTVAGAGLGFLGGHFELSTRAAIASLLAPFGILLGALELSKWRVRPFQWDRETDQRWMRFGAWTGAILNGLTLGLGFISRLGYWLWYALPAGAFLSGDVVFSATLFGLYGFVRAIIPVLTSTYLAYSRPSNERSMRPAQRWMIGWLREARLLAACQLICLSVATVVAVGA
jgi:hypothetical protein